MSDLSHDTADDGFHEIQLSGKQLVFLFIVTTTVIVVVFLCGVKVGRGARAAQGEEPEQTAAATTALQPPPPTAAPPADPPAPAAETPDDLSYHKRLQGQGTPPESLKPQDQKPTEPAPRQAPPAAASRAAAPPPPTDNLPTSGRPGTWAVQVIATRDRDIASSVLKRLAAKGYPAFLVNPPAGASPAFFKVQVGRYTEKGEAEQVSLRIKKEEQFQSWITR